MAIEHFISKRVLYRPKDVIVCWREVRRIYRLGKDFKTELIYEGDFFGSVGAGVVVKEDGRPLF